MALTLRQRAEKYAGWYEVMDSWVILPTDLAFARRSSDRLSLRATAELGLELGRAVAKTLLVAPALMYHQAQFVRTAHKEGLSFLSNSEIELTMHMMTLNTATQHQSPSNPLQTD